MMDRLISGLIAVSLAFLVWLYARGREQESLDSVPIPVQLALAPGQEERYDLELNGPAQVLVSFTGSPSGIRELRGMLQRGEIRVGLTVAVPEDQQAESRILDTVRVEAADVPAPAGVSAVVLEGRNRIPVTLRRLVDRRLPVRLEHAPDDDIGQIELQPATVLVHGPQEILEHLRALPTQLCSLPPRNEAAPGQEMVSVVRVPLVRELEGRPIRTVPTAVTARLTRRPRQKVYQITDVPVRFLCPADFGLRPHFGKERAGRITVRVVGPAADSPPPVTAFIDLTHGSFKPGLYANVPIRLQLPPEFQQAQELPRSSAFQLLPIGVPAKEPAND